MENVKQGDEEKKARTKEKKEERRREKRKKRRQKEDKHILVRNNTKTDGDLQNHYGQQGCLPI